jgi:hypothetical protein
LSFAAKEKTMEGKRAELGPAGGGGGAEVADTWREVRLWWLDGVSWYFD